MRTDLVLATGLGPRLDDSEATDPLEHLPVGARRPTAAGHDDDRPVAPGVEPPVAGASVRQPTVVTHRHVGLVHVAPAKRLGQRPVHRRVLGEQHHAGRVPVEAVDDAGRVP